MIWFDGFPRQVTKERRKKTSMNKQPLIVVGRGVWSLWMLEVGRRSPRVQCSSPSNIMPAHLDYSHISSCMFDHLVLWERYRLISARDNSQRHACPVSSPCKRQPDRSTSINNNWSRFAGDPHTWNHWDRWHVKNVTIKNWAALNCQRGIGDAWHLHIRNHHVTEFAWDIQDSDQHSWPV